VVAAAVGVREGTAGFAGGLGAMSCLCEDGASEVPTVDLPARLAGSTSSSSTRRAASGPVLADARLAAAGPPSSSPSTIRAGRPGPGRRAAARRLLDGRGYEDVHPVPDPRTDGVGMVWAWRG
jgi:hypothetical protein